MILFAREDPLNQKNVKDSYMYGNNSNIPHTLNEEKLQSPHWMPINLLKNHLLSNSLLISDGNARLAQKSSSFGNYICFPGLKIEDISNSRLNLEFQSIIKDFKSYDITVMLGFKDLQDIFMMPECVKPSRCIAEKVQRLNSTYCDIKNQFQDLKFIPPLPVPKIKEFDVWGYRMVLDPEALQNAYKSIFLCHINQDLVDSISSIQHKIVHDHDHHFISGTLDSHIALCERLHHIG